MKGPQEKQIWSAGTGRVCLKWKVRLRGPRLPCSKEARNGMSGYAELNSTLKWLLL